MTFNKSEQGITLWSVWQSMCFVFQSSQEQYAIVSYFKFFAIVQLFFINIYNFKDMFLSIYNLNENILNAHVYVVVVYENNN